MVGDPAKSKFLTPDEALECVRQQESRFSSEANDVGPRARSHVSARALDTVAAFIWTGDRAVQNKPFALLHTPPDPGRVAIVGHYRNWVRGSRPVFADARVPRCAVQGFLSAATMIGLVQVSVPWEPFHSRRTLRRTFAHDPVARHLPRGFSTFSVLEPGFAPVYPGEPDPWGAVFMVKGFGSAHAS
jgi:hypothetical protein